jgi:hypothetical protein
VSGLSDTAATITWTTDEPASSQVDYGLTTTYGSQTLLDPSLVTSHQVNLSGLNVSTTYFYQVRSSDAAGNTAFAGGYTLTTLAPVNQPPVVSAGPDQAITLPAAATLNGTAIDDGVPAESALLVSWSKVSGAGTVTFSTPTSLTTSASFSAPDVYVLRLTASDGSLNAYDDVPLTVNPAADTTAPTVSITSPLPGSVPRTTRLTLTASASDNVGVVSVSFWVNNSRLLCTDLSAPYSCPWKVPGATGKTYQLKATTTDGAGNVGNSAIVTVTAQ